MNAKDFSLLDLNEKQFSIAEGEVHWTNPFASITGANCNFVEAFLKSGNPKKDYPNWYALLNGQELVFNASASFFTFEVESEEKQNLFFDSLKNLDSHVCSFDGKKLDVDWRVEILSFPQKNDFRVEKNGPHRRTFHYTVPIRVFIRDEFAPSENLLEYYGDKSWKAPFPSWEIRPLLQWIRDYIEHPDYFYCYHYTSNDCLVLFKTPEESRDSMDAVIEDFVNHYELDREILRSACLWFCSAQKGRDCVKDFLESESRIKSLQNRREAEMVVPLKDTDMSIQLNVDLSRKDWHDAFLKNRERDVGLFTQSLGEFLSKGLDQRDEWSGEKVVAAIRKNPELFINCGNARFSQFAKAVIACNAQNLSDEEYQRLYSPGKRSVSECEDGKINVAYEFPMDEEESPS